MTPITVRSTITLHDNSDEVDVAMIVGYANFSDGTISVKPVGGQMTTLFSNVKADKHYPLGAGSDLLTKHIRMILSGTVGDPNGAVQGHFFVTCAFYQASQSIGSSDPVSGQYGAGEARQDFNIICSFT
jgi:hypothetical protein